LGLPLSAESKNLDVASFRPDAVLISHPHQDHFGLIDALDSSVPVYIGELGKRLIDAPRMILGKALPANLFRYFKNRQHFSVGDFTITPYLVDHSAVDAYGFSIEAEGKKVFYSGDFRAHGRKSVLYKSIVENPPQDIDLLFMEGTMLERSNDDFPTEADVEQRIYDTIKAQENITFLISSSQNIDRIVSAYRACKRAHKTMVIDIYTAWVLEQLKFVSDSVPNMEWEPVKVYTSYSQNEKLKEHPDFFGDFRKRLFKNRVHKEELQANPHDYLSLGKMSHFKIIDLYKAIRPVNVIYSQWLGYLSYSNNEYYGAEAIAAYRNDPQVNFVYAHTSGHATVKDLQTFAKALKPKMLVPVHTEYASKFNQLFDCVVEIADNQIFTLNDKGEELMLKKGSDTTENQLINRLLQMQKMAIELQKRDTAKLAKQDRYIRICGESFRAVSLRDGYPLCGCAKSGTEQLAIIDRQFDLFDNKPNDLKLSVLEKKKERALQSWIIKQSLIHNRDMMILLKQEKGSFDKLLFALDEVSLGDKNHPVRSVPGLRLNISSSTTAVRCDLLAVGKKDGKIFPVIIELKSSRNKKDLIAQVDNFAELICRFRDYFLPLLETCTGLQINDYTPRKIIIWPKPETSKPITQKHQEELTDAGISVLEYTDQKNESPRYVFDAHWAKE
jgi:ribonuclease J